MIRGIRLNIFFHFILFCIIFIGVQSSIASETFQNNLLKVDVKENSLGEVKMTLYTNKPYSDSVTVNKKSDFEYVILLPETANSLTAKPALNLPSNIIKDLNIKTQQYDNQVKGYTKITILTTKPAQINTQIQTLNSANQLSESDYNELLSQPTKKVAKQTSSAKKEPKNSIQKATLAVLPPAKIKDRSKPKLVSQKYITVATPKLVQKPIQKQNLVPEPSAVKKTELPVVKAPITETPVAETNIQPEKVTQEVIPNIEPPKVENQTQAIIPQKNIVTDYKNVLKNNFYTILGAIVLLLILLLLGVKKTNRNNAKQKKAFATHLDEKPTSVIDYAQNISEDMSWKEKFKTYVDTVESKPSENTPPPAETPVPNQELDELFIDESFLNDNDERNINELFDENETLESEESIEKEFVEEDSFEPFEQYKAEETITEEDDSLYEEIFEEEEPEIEEQNEFVKSEFVIDDEKGFYLVDFENSTSLVGHIEDEIFVLKRFDEKIQAPIQARLNEHNGSSVNYMTKVGSYRAIVEVTPKDMSLLIEL